MELKINDSIFIPSSRCSRCDRVLDATTGVEAPEPLAGDYSVCFYCGKLMVFNEDKTLAEPSREDLEEFKANSPNSFAMACRLSGIFFAERSGRLN